MKLNGDDANSTQLEGKKLKGRGVKEGFKLDGRFLEIEKESPAIELGEEPDQEHAKGHETKKERDERLKREALVAKQLLAAQKRGQTPDENSRLTDDPNLRLDEIEQGITLSQTKGRPVPKQEFKKDPNREIAISEHGGQNHHEAHSKRNDMPLVEAILGETSAKLMAIPGELKISDKENAPPGSVPATKVDDVRGKEGPGQGLGF